MRHYSGQVWLEVHQIVLGQWWVLTQCPHWISSLSEVWGLVSSRLQGVLSDQRSSLTLSVVVAELVSVEPTWWELLLSLPSWFCLPFQHLSWSLSSPFSSENP